MTANFPSLVSAGLLRSGGVDLTHPMMTSCGSGVTPALLPLSLLKIGAPGVAVYDASWSGIWDALKDTSIDL